MDPIIEFYNSIYTPRIWQLYSNAAIEKALPRSKLILDKLNQYLNEHPEFYNKLRTNLWRIHPNPISILTDKLPIDLWYLIDGFIHEDPYHLFIQKCKEYYISVLLSQIKEEIGIQEKHIRKKDKFENVYCYYYNMHRVKQCKSMQRFINNYKDSYLKN
jgi:hypothetical protein